MMRWPGPTFDLRAALDHELAAAAAALEQEPGAKAIHRCRVGIKRARALARIGAVCAPGLARVFQSSARQVMGELARARELAALADAARDIAARQPKKRSAALRGVADALDRERAALPTTDIVAAKTGLKDLLALAQVWPEASSRQLHRGAVRIAKRARHAAWRGRGAKEAERRHEWRKREKDRLYASSILAHDWPRKRRRKASERLGELLGRERDALLLAAALQRDPELAGGRARSKRALKALEARAVKIGGRADKLGARVYT
jgi:CHAD domain-containing protein